jgi:DNA recombination protein RmuC
LGELVLKSIRKSGLEKHEYEVQQSFTTEEGNRVFPDVINPPMAEDDCHSKFP